MRNIAIIVAVTVLLVKIIDVAVPRPTQRGTAHPDTIYAVKTIYDSVTVISRAADTIKIRIKDVGPLTEQDVVRIVCGQKRSYGDKRDEFDFNVYGMVFCPRDGRETP